MKEIVASARRLENLSYEATQNLDEYIFTDPKAISYDVAAATEMMGDDTFHPQHDPLLL